MNYQTTAEELANRIYDLIPQNPSILDMQDVFDLLKIPGFKCDDIAPSLAQAGFALDKAKRMYTGEL